MGSDLYPQKPLMELVEIYDSMRVPIKKSERKPGPFPYYGASGIADYIDSYVFDGEYLLLSEDGENLKTQNTPLAFMATGKFWVNNHAHVLKGNANSNTRFICYALQISDVQSALSGSTRPKLTQGDMIRIPVFAPNQATQRAIAHILGTLDDKIECNRRMNETLEKMAQAIFKSWFVDFDPVRWNMDAKNGKAVGKPPVPPEILKRFPDSFQESELGLIPKGWEVGPLSSIAISHRRLVQPSDITPEVPYIGLEHMPRQSISLEKWGCAEDVKSSKFSFYQGEILFGKLRPYFHKVGSAPVDGVCSTDILVLAPKLDYWASFVLSLVSSQAFVSYTDKCSSGTKMPRTNWKDMGKYLISLPPDGLAMVFQQHTSNLFNRVLFVIGQINRLSALRDTLLPKLISGELRIKDAEKFIEALS